MDSGIRTSQMCEMEIMRVNSAIIRKDLQKSRGCNLQLKDCSILQLVRLNVCGYDYDHRRNCANEG